MFNLFQPSPRWTWVNSGGQAHRTARSLSEFPLSSWSSSFFFLPTHSLWDLFLCQQPSVGQISPESLFLRCLNELWSGQNGWCMFETHHIPDSHPESVQFLLTDFKFQGICHHFVFLFVLYSGFCFTCIVCYKDYNPTEGDGRKNLACGDWGKDSHSEKYDVLQP